MITNVFVTPPINAPKAPYHSQAILTGPVVRVEIRGDAVAGMVSVDLRTSQQAAALASTFTEAAIELGRREHEAALLAAGK